MSTGTEHAPWPPGGDGASETAPASAGGAGGAGEPVVAETDVGARRRGRADEERAGDAGRTASPAPGPVPAPEADLAALLVDVEHQRDDYLDALRRLQAEFDNYRKRVERQQREVADSAVGALAKELLPVLDTADLALAHGAGEDVKQVTGVLFDILAKQGLERLDPEGQAFDPEHHDAVAHEPGEGEDAPERPEVTEVMRAGYLWRGRVLRPAMVKVRG